MTAATLPTGWFLENAWLIPIIPAIGFVLIIALGKRLPAKGSEIGIVSIGASLVLAIGATYQWIDRVSAAGGGEHAGPISGVFGFARSIFPSASEAGTETYVEPVIKSWTWWQSGGLEFGFGQHIDGLAIMLLLLVTFISL
ncbi:MAG: hypothetical protein EBS20_07445, partial [Actinobacteria bacterium]|nr:hypothetical protein [Actinomycetota bacterium]